MKEREKLTRKDAQQTKQDDLQAHLWLHTGSQSYHIFISHITNPSQFLSSRVHSWLNMTEYICLWCENVWKCSWNRLKYEPVLHHRPHDILGIQVLPTLDLQFQKYPFSI